MKRKKVVKMLLILSAGAMLTGCGGNTIRETGGAISALQDANAYVTEHQAGLNEYFDALEAERKEATVERREDAVLSGSGVGTVSSDPNASLYETFTSEMDGFVGDPDTITLHVMEKEGSRFDTDSREIDLRESLLLFLMNDTDHETAQVFLRTLKTACPLPEIKWNRQRNRSLHKIIRQRNAHIRRLFCNF